MSEVKSFVMQAQARLLRFLRNGSDVSTRTLSQINTLRHQTFQGDCRPREDCAYISPFTQNNKYVDVKSWNKKHL